MKIEEDGGDVIILAGTCDVSDSSILYRLELSDDIHVLTDRDIIQKTIVVVECGEYKWVNEGLGDFSKIEIFLHRKCCRVENRWICRCTCT